MPISVFEKINEKAKEQGGKIFSNPRNAASGSVRMKDASVTTDRELQFFAYDIGNFHEYVSEKSLKTYNSVIYDLKLL
jgi:DNA ligase (NAD+)